MKNFNGKILFLDRSDINTDEIIPAKYLTEIEREALKPYLLEDLQLGGFNHKTDIPGKSAIITRDNFGCGSSREHAPWALADFGFKAIEKPVHVHDLHATILHLLGFDHTKLTFRFQGRDYRLTDVHGELVRPILA